MTGENAETKKQRSRQKPPSQSSKSLKWEASSLARDGENTKIEHTKIVQGTI